MTQTLSDGVDLIERIQKLPPELQDQIEGWVYEMAFCPGFLYLQSAWEGHKRNKKHITANLQLLTVDRYVFTKYRNRIWSENTLVIGVGEASPTTGFLHEIPISLHERIRKVVLKFTVRDMGDAWEKYRSKVLYSKSMKHEEVSNETNRPEIMAAGDRGTGDDSAAQAAAAVNRGHLPESTRYSLNADLITIWYEKSGCIFQLSLEELTLDFTECYGFGGAWLGYDLIDWLFTYDFRKAAKLQILAPDEVYTDDVLEYIRDMYDDPDDEGLNLECRSNRSTS